MGTNAWAPVVNPLRHPLWGRNEEGFSEDPHLTAALAGAYCAGLKGDHDTFWLTVPTLKHFLAYNNEADRNVSSSQLRARVLHEYELPAYRGPIEDGVAGAVMLSYNLVNGRPAHVSDLVAGELRQWRNGEDITIVTDAGAPSSLYTAEKYFDDGPSAYAAALRAGVDSFTEDSDNPEPSLRHLHEALDRGLITDADIDRAVLRLLTLRERTGEFEPDGGPVWLASGRNSWAIRPMWRWPGRRPGSPWCCFGTDPRPAQRDPCFRWVRARKGGGDRRRSAPRC